MYMVCMYVYVYMCTNRCMLMYIQIFNYILKVCNNFSSPNAILINDIPDEEKFDLES